MNLFEIFLRNALNNHISNHFNDPNWILTEKNGFMNNISLARSGYFLRNSVTKAEITMLRKAIHVTSAKIIAEQTLGFWTAFFDNHNFKLVAGCPLRAFPNKPSNINRSNIWAMLKEIREFRNRIYHNEPICFKGNTIDFTKARQIRDDVHLIIKWIEPELLNYTEYFNNIDKKITSANRL